VGGKVTPFSVPISFPSCQGRTDAEILRYEKSERWREREKRDRGRIEEEVGGRNTVFVGIGSSSRVISRGFW
jgi:hypothetical protein